MAKTPNMEKERKVVSKAHHNWVPTEDIKVRLAETHPRLEFRWLEKEHIHGVDSIVHGTCQEHNQVVPMHVGNLWRGTTKYGCPACAYELGGECEGSETFHVKRNHPNYQGRSKVEFNLFMAVKDAFPDALSGHKMKGRKEIDIWVPSIGAGVEYNGNFYHAEDRGRGEAYHFDKTNSGWKEDKFILHVFTEEGGNVPAIIETLKVFGEYRDRQAVKGATFQYGPLSAGSAEAFHRDHNPVKNFNTPDWDLHIAIYDSNFKTVGVMSGVRRYSFITKITVIEFGVPVGDILAALAKQQNSYPTLLLDSRNPLEILAAKRCSVLVPCRAIQPMPLPMDSSYRIIPIRDKVYFERLNEMIKPVSGEFVRAWDTGRLVFHVKGRKPLWLQ